MNPLQPPTTVLVKLGCIARHVEELLSPAGHAHDQAAIEGLLSDPQVQEWMDQADALALLPLKR